MEQLTFLSESAKYISPAPEKLRGIHIKSLIREKMRFEMGLPWSLALPNGLYVYNLKERQRKTFFFTLYTYFSCEVLEDSSTVHCCGGSHSSVACCSVLQMSVDTSHRKLQKASNI